MTIEKKTGGLAFPDPGRAQSAKQRSVLLERGMTLRDYFAAHAPTPQEPMELDDHCAYRYRYADAMLHERDK